MVETVKPFLAIMAVIAVLSAANLVASFIRYPTFSRLGGILLIVAVLAVGILAIRALTRKDKK